MEKNNSELLPKEGIDEQLPEANIEGDGGDERYGVAAQLSGSQPYKSASFLIPDFPPLAVPTEFVPAAIVTNTEQSPKDKVRMAEDLLNQYEGMGTVDAHAAHQTTEDLKMISAAS